MDATPVRSVRRRARSASPGVQKSIAQAAAAPQQETPVPRRRRRTCSPDAAPNATPVRASASGRRSVTSVERLQQYLLQDEELKPTPSPAPKFGDRLLALDAQAAPVVDKQPLLMLGADSAGQQLFSFGGAVYRVKNYEAFTEMLPSEAPKRTLSSLQAAQRASRKLNSAPSRKGSFGLPPTNGAEKPDMHTILAMYAEAFAAEPALTELRVESKDEGKVSFSMDGNLYRASEETYRDMLPPQAAPKKPRSLAELRAAQRARAASRQEPATRWPSQLTQPRVAEPPTQQAILAQLAADNGSGPTGGA